MTEDILRTYPRSRPSLPEEYQKIYTQNYKGNRNGEGLIQSLSQKTEGWMHRKVASDTLSGDVLEIGAGNLNHLSFRRQTSQYDIVEPFRDLYADSPQLGEVRNIFADIALVPDTNRYRNIISIAALEHIVDLPICVAKTGLLLKSGGRFLVGIPSEGGALWGAAWRLTTGLAFKLRTGLSYQTLMRHEHISDAQEILSIVKYFFSDVTVHRFPLPSHHFSLFAYIRAENPRLEKCGQYLLSTLPQGGFPE